MTATDMWCTYCEKNTHNDADCWCTRVIVQHTPFPARARVRLIAMHVRFIVENWNQEQSC